MMFAPFYDKCQGRCARKEATSTNFYQFLASRVAGVHLDRGKPGELCAQVSTGGLANARRASDQHGSIYVRAILSGLLEAGFQAIGPVP